MAARRLLSLVVSPKGADKGDVLGQAVVCCKGLKLGKVGDVLLQARVVSAVQQAASSASRVRAERPTGGSTAGLSPPAAPASHDKVDVLPGVGQF